MAIATLQQLGQLTPGDLVRYLGDYRNWVGQLRQEAAEFLQFLTYGGAGMSASTHDYVDASTKRRFLALWAQEPSVGDYQGGS